MPLFISAVGKEVGANECVRSIGEVRFNVTVCASLKGFWEASVGFSVGDLFSPPMG